MSFSTINSFFAVSILEISFYLSCIFCDSQSSTFFLGLQQFFFIGTLCLTAVKYLCKKLWLFLFIGWQFFIISEIEILTLKFSEHIFANKNGEILNCFVWSLTSIFINSITLVFVSMGYKCLRWWCNGFVLFLNTWKLSKTRDSLMNWIFNWYLRLVVFIHFRLLSIFLFISIILC